MRRVISHLLIGQNKSLTANNLWASMIPDYDYTLLFPQKFRSFVIDALRPLCAGDSGAALTDADRTEPVEVPVSFHSWPDMPAEVVEEYPLLSDGRHGLGNVYLSVGPSRWNEFPSAIEFRPWPCTRGLQRAVIGSAQLRGELVRVLESCGGYAGYVVNESCDPVEFWNESSGRSNDGHPPEYANQRQVEPSEPEA